MKLPIQQVFPLNSDLSELFPLSIGNVSDTASNFEKAGTVFSDMRQSLNSPHRRRAQLLRGFVEQASERVIRMKFPFEGGGRGMALLLMLLLILLPSLGLAQQSAPADAQLDQYLQQAAQNNPELKARYQQYLSALQQVPQVNTLPDPQLSFGYFISSIETRVGPQQARFGLTQMFPWFGTLGARGDVTTQRARATFESFQEVRNRLFFQVHEKWYQLYNIEQSVRIMRENIDILQTLESLATSRYETAEVSQADILLVQIEKEDLKTRLKGLKDDRSVAAQEFKELLNSPRVNQIGTVDSLHRLQLSISGQELEKAVRQQNPRLTKLDYESSSARGSIEVARKEGFPTFGIGVDYIITGRRDMALADNGRDAVLARGSIQIPLYRKKYRARERQAKIELRSVQNQYEAIQNKLQTQLDQALRDYYDAERQLVLYEDIQLQRTRQALDILTEEYANAETNFEELLRLQRKLLDYELARENALVDLNTAVAYIEYLYGKYNVNPDEI